MMFSRLLALAGPDAEPIPQRLNQIATAQPAWRANLFWFRLFIFAYVATRAFVSRGVEQHIGPVYEPLQYLIGIVCIVGFVPMLSIWAARLACVLVLLHIVLTLPFTANHVFLEWIILLLLALLDERRDEREAELLLQSLRWLVAVFFFYTGLQKVLYGYYFQGEFLAFLTATEDRFADFFRYVIPAGELQRLQSLGGYDQLGAGPYRVDSPLFVIISNGTYLFEMLAGVALMFPRTRRIAAIAGIGFVIMIELAAREIIFGLLTINLMLMFLPGAWNRTLFPLFVLLYLYLVANEFGLGPLSLPFTYYG